MTTESAVRAVLTGLVSSRVYAIGEVPDTPTSPYIVLQIVSTVPGNLKNTDTQKRVQVDVYARGYDAAKGLEASVRAAMSAATFSNCFLVSRDAFDPGVKLNRQIIDFYAWD